MTKTSSWPYRSEAKAINLPSGDQTGDESCAGPAVSATARPPAEGTVKMCPRKLNAIVIPSGEMLGYRSQRGLLSIPRGGRDISGVVANSDLARGLRLRAKTAIPRRRKGDLVFDTNETGLNIGSRTHAESV